MTTFLGNLQAWFYKGSSTVLILQFHSVQIPDPMQASPRAGDRSLTLNRAAQKQQPAPDIEMQSALHQKVSSITISLCEKAASSLRHLKRNAMVWAAWWDNKGPFRHFVCQDRSILEHEGRDEEGRIVTDSAYRNMWEERKLEKKSYIMTFCEKQQRKKIKV